MSAYDTHKTRFSDSSLVDEICVKCGATDAIGDDRLNQPCPCADSDEEPYAGPVAFFGGCLLVTK